MKKIKRPRKYFAPQNEGTERKCDHPGCEKAGEYRAPKDRKLKDYYWFCLEHVQEYNAQWNYYAGEIPEEDEGPKARMHFKGFRSKVRYKHGYSFKDDFGFFGEYATDYSAIDDEIMYNAEERKFLAKYGAPTLPFYNDENNRLSLSLGIGSTPYTVIMNRSGKKVATIQGEADWNSEKLYKMIKKLIKPAQANPTAPAPLPAALPAVPASTTPASATHQAAPKPHDI